MFSNLKSYMMECVVSGKCHKARTFQNSLKILESILFLLINITLTIYFDFKMYNNVLRRGEKKLFEYVFIFISALF